MEATITKKLVNTQERRWEHVLDGYVLIGRDKFTPVDYIIGIKDGTLFNFTSGKECLLNLADSDDFEYSLEMKNNKIRKYFYTWSNGTETKYGFYSDADFGTLKRENPQVKYMKHENAWLEN